MIIAVDYDDTFSRDPVARFHSLSIMKTAKHNIIGVTMRNERQINDIDPRYFIICEYVYYTNLKQKRQFLEEMNIFPHVWIDDSPEFIVKSVALFCPSCTDNMLSKINETKN